MKNKLKRENVKDFTSGKILPDENSLDEFDKEALEGLKMAGELEPELFSRIDSKIDSTLVTKSKQWVRIVWMSVAACLTLAIGFYFWTKLQLTQSDKEQQFTDVIKLDSTKEQEKTPELAQAEPPKKEIKAKDENSVSKENLRDEQITLSVEEDLAVVGNSEDFSVAENEQMDNVIESEEKSKDQEGASVAVQPSVQQNNEERVKSLEVENKKKSKNSSKKPNEQSPSVSRKEEEVVASSFSVADSISLNEVAIISDKASVAKYPGGPVSLLQFYRQQIASTALNSFSGKTVIISVFVTSQGKATKPKIVQGIPDCSSCDQELIRVSKLMPAWNPAISNNKPFGKRISFSLSF